MPKGVYPRNESHIEICRRANLGRSPWNKGTKGMIKPNSGSFGYGQKGHNVSHSEEAKIKMSNALKSAWASGVFNDRPGVSRETAEKIRATLRNGTTETCSECGCDFYRSPSSRQKFCCFVCLRKHLKRKSDATQQQYPKKHILNAEYKKWRSAVFNRDNNTCCICGTNGEKNHPHHIVSFAYYPHVRYDINNGITLCIKCHKDVHRNS